ncbi:MAG: retroviral-like aspartic protease family protein [Bacteroidetes bacterium]|nr:retroviral-like aspartic protease family protein [Bacteroidota bacterium]MBU1721085.1 retroviral-like aspartic protease family protein [Bacteroidota bacterium]
MLKAAIGLDILSLEEGCHLFLSATLNEKPARLLVDTGASRTVFDINRAGTFFEKDEFRRNEELSTGLGTNSMESHYAVADSLELGILRLKDVTIILLDMAYVNDSYRLLQIPEIDGVIGSDLLRKLDGIIDFRKRMLSLRYTKRSGLELAD